MESVSSRPKRRLGPDDRRLKVRRCLNCRTGHRKCDSNRPCSGCASRKITCKDDSKARIEFPLVPVPVSVSPQPKLGENVTNEWTFYINGFFQLIGDDKHLPIPLEALSKRSLSKHLYQENDNPVWHAAIAIGAAFRSFQRHNQDAESKHCLPTIAGSAAERAKTLIDRSASSRDAEVGLSSVIAALLIDIYLLTTDDTSIQVVGWAENTVHSLVRQWLRKSAADQSMKPFIRTFWILGCVYSFELDLDPELNDNEWFSPPADDLEFWSLDSWNHSHSYRKQCVTQAIDYLLPRLAQLAKLNAQSVSLRHHRLDGTAYPPLSSTRSQRFREDLQSNRDSHTEDTDFSVMAYRKEAESLFRSLDELSRTLDIVFEGTPAQASRVASERLSPSSKGTICLLKVYTDMLRLGLSRLLSHSAPSEESKSCTTISVLSQDITNARILRSLCMLEQRLLQDAQPAIPNETSPPVETASKVGLESILYFPALTVIALEVRCIGLRNRVKAIFHAIQARGFIVAKTGLQDFELAWSATASGCGDFCSCGQTT